MANEYRGEVDIKIDGVDYKMRPTFQALAGIEADLGKRLMPIARDVFNTDIGVTEVATIIYHGVSASGANVSLETVGKAVAKAGMLNYVAPITNFIKLGLGGEDEGKDEQTEETEEKS